MNYTDRNKSICRSARRLLAIACVALYALFASTAFKVQAWTVTHEHLTYDVMYKWGLINKKAGSVVLATSEVEKPLFNARLTAATAPWAEKFYYVRDTLLGVIDTQTLLPQRYERIAYEGGNFSHDLVTYSREGSKVTGDARIQRKKKRQEMTSDRRVHQADGVTLDMLSSFYYMRNIDFPALKAGASVHLNIFSGKKKERLTIHYKGMENVKIGKESYPAYHITFTFTQDDGRVSSDNMDAWISTGARRIPLLLEGKLPVGKVRAVYSGNLSQL